MQSECDLCTVLFLKNKKCKIFGCREGHIFDILCDENGKPTEVINDGVISSFNVFNIESRERLVDK